MPGRCMQDAHLGGRPPCPRFMAFLWTYRPIRSGRSISQEAELRLELSLDMRRHLTLVKGNVWSPIFFHGNESMLVPLGNDPRDFPVPEGDPPHEEHWITLKAERPDDLKLLRNYFGGLPYPWTQDETKQGK